jgi:hypothetical protein
MRFCFSLLTHSATSPNASQLGNQSRKPEGLRGLVALSVNTEDTPHRNEEYRKQAPMLVIGVYECVDKKDM